MRDLIEITVIVLLALAAVAAGIILSTAYLAVYITVAIGRALINALRGSSHKPHSVWWMT